MNSARPSAGTHAFSALRVPTGRWFDGRPLESRRSQRSPRGRPTLPVGTPNAINAFFAVDIRCFLETTCDATTQRSGNAFQLLGVSNVDVLTTEGTEATENDSKAVDGRPQVVGWALAHAGSCLPPQIRPARAQHCHSRRGRKGNLNWQPRTDNWELLFQPLMNADEHGFSTQD